MLCIAVHFGAFAQDYDQPHTFEFSAATNVTYNDFHPSSIAPGWGISGNILGNQQRFGYLTVGADYDRMHISKTSRSTRHLHTFTPNIGYRVQLGAKKRWFVLAGIGRTIGMIAIRVPDPFPLQPGRLPGGGHREETANYGDYNWGGKAGFGVALPVGTRHLIIKQTVGGFAGPFDFFPSSEIKAAYTRLSVAFAFG